MPTPKQVRFHYARITRLHDKLARALTDAHHAGVIKFAQENWKDESPCATNFETERRIEKTTEKSLAKAMRQEIERGVNR